MSTVISIHHLDSADSSSNQKGSRDEIVRAFRGQLCRAAEIVDKKNQPKKRKATDPQLVTLNFSVTFAPSAIRSFSQTKVRKVDKSDIVDTECPHCFGRGFFYDETYNYKKLTFRPCGQCADSGRVQIKPALNHDAGISQDDLKSVLDYKGYIEILEPSAQDFNEIVKKLCLIFDLSFENIKEKGILPVNNLWGDNVDNVSKLISTYATMKIKEKTINRMALDKTPTNTHTTHNVLCISKTN